MFGIFSYGIASPRVGFKTGDFVLDLEVIGLLGFFHEVPVNPAVFAQPTLNDFIALGKAAWLAVQDRINHLLNDPEQPLASIHDQVFIEATRVTMHLPVQIGDYTDFYAGIEHARNVGLMFRPGGDPLLPNYRHLPVAYHGRASSIVVSGTPVKRPNGQFLRQNQPVFGPTEALDFELELGLIMGKNTSPGTVVSVDEAEDCLFGIVLFNDWSARDIQRWEYQPLGPFLAKNFASTMSAWVLPFHQLDAVRIAGPVQDPVPLPYLQTRQPGHFDIHLEVLLQPANGSEVLLSQSNTRHLYWNFAQMIAHHTVNGCNLKVGDIMASGTISAPAAENSQTGTFGSLLELSWGGQKPVTLPDGSTRTYLHDGDTVTLRGWIDTGAARIDLGEARGQVVG